MPHGKFTPPKDRSGPKPVKRINNSMYPEVRVKGNGEVCMTYEAFKALPPRNIEKMLAEQPGRMKEAAKRAALRVTHNV